MRIIELSVENHRSFREGFTLDMRRPGFKRKLPPSNKTWDDVLYPTAAIFGANASGKSNALKALAYIQLALMNSSGSWLNEKTMMRDPYTLQKDARQGTSSYALDFLLRDDFTKRGPRGTLRRFQYKFEVNPDGVTRELLCIYYSSRPTTLIERDLQGGRSNVRLASGLGGPIHVSKRELVLSRAAVLEAPVLSNICRGIIDGADVVGLSDDERKSRIDSLTKDLSEGAVSRADVAALAAVADLGIQDVSVDEKEIPKDVLARLRALIEAARVSASDDSEAEGEDENLTLGDGIQKLLMRDLRFVHGGAEDADAYLPLGAQSDGTLAWLALGSAILQALRNGTALLVDEIDSSLHTNLTREIIDLFNDTETNRHGAQLIFTTHDPGLISPQTDLLEDSQIWISEKDAEGVSELYSLADFDDLRRKSNREKQYLEGRFGGVPSLAFGLFSSLLASEPELDPPHEGMEP